MTVRGPARTSKRSRPRLPAPKARVPAWPAKAMYPRANGNRRRVSTVSPATAPTGAIFTQHAVAPEGHRDRERDPGKLAGRHRDVGHSGRGEANGEPGRPVQALPEDEHAEEHADEGVDEVAEASFENAAAQHREDVDQPVGRDQERAGHEEEKGAPRSKRGQELAAQSLPENHGHENHECPDHPVRQDLDRRREREGLEVDGKDPPEHVGGRSRGESLISGRRAR